MRQIRQESADTPLPLLSPALDADGKNTLWWSPLATTMCIPWHRELAWEERRGRVTPGRKGEMAARGRCGMNDMASRGSDSKKPWRGEMAARTP